MLTKQVLQEKQLQVNPRHDILKFISENKGVLNSNTFGITTNERYDQE